MKKDNLVVATQSFIQQNEPFKLGQVYRSIVMDEVKDKPYMIFGCVFAAKNVPQYFEFLYDVIIREWTKAGIVKDGKVISKTAFGKLLDVHTYGRGRTGFKVGYLIIGHPKECMYQFDCGVRLTSQKELIDYAYEVVESVIGGNVEPFDPVYGNIRRGNSGIPISYHEIYWK